MAPSTIGMSGIDAGPTLEDMQSAIKRSRKLDLLHNGVHVPYRRVAPRRLRQAANR